MTDEKRQDAQAGFVLGQKYAYATASLVIGIASFLSLLGFEKGVLAILFAWLALKGSPRPALAERRSWARAGLVMGILMLAGIGVLLTLFFDRFREIITAIQRLQ